MTSFNFWAIAFPSQASCDFSSNLFKENVLLFCLLLRLYQTETAVCFLHLKIIHIGNQLKYYF